MGILNIQNLQSIRMCNHIWSCEHFSQGNFFHNFSHECTHQCIHYPHISIHKTHNLFFSSLFTYFVSISQAPCLRKSSATPRRSWRSSTLCTASTRTRRSYQTQHWCMTCSMRRQTIRSTRQRKVSCNCVLLI